MLFITHEYTSTENFTYVHGKKLSAPKSGTIGSFQCSMMFRPYLDIYTQVTRECQ